jgi:polysaccharide biosynthesis protein VpsJ
MAKAHTSDADSTVTRERLVAAVRRDFSLGTSSNWRSHDPWDLLLSPSARPLTQISPFAARVVLQLGRRSGVGLRRLLRVPVHEEPKALADFLQAAVILDQLGETWPGEFVSELSTRLRDRAVATRVGLGWGNAFPYASRFISVPANEPNIYITTAACHALLDDYEFAGREESLQAAVLGAQYMLRDLGTFRVGETYWLRYFAGSDAPIVNVQASASSLFARVAAIQPDDELVEAADRAAETVIAAQRDNGSWTYSVDGRGDFIDGFHTGFTLQGLLEYAASRPGGKPAAIDAAVAAGFVYFKEHLLTADGRPRDFADGAASRDGQALAQAIQTLVLCGDGGDTATAGRIWLLTDAQRGQARFPALRWTIGPFALATAFLARALTDG